VFDLVALDPWDSGRLALAAADAVDEYRLLVIPTALGAGERPFVGRGSGR
jgi:hypothetical protein